MLRGITDTHFKTLPSNKTEVKNKREKKKLSSGRKARNGTYTAFVYIIH